MADTNTPRDPEIIRREIMIADLSATNCALQADGMLKQIDLLAGKVEALKAPHDAHAARKIALEAELEAALKAEPGPA